MKTILDFQNAKGKEVLSWITAYTYDIAMAAEQAGIDQILVGDSGYMCVKGYTNTNFATMDGMIDLCQSVRRGAKNTFIWGDMPSSSYEPSNEVAIKNALRFIKEGECNGVKLEGTSDLICERIRAISQCNIIVCGHAGLTPQSSDSLGGYKCQGKTKDSFFQLFSNCKRIQDSGASQLLLEAVVPEVTKQICKSLYIPVAGIGAGLADVQLIICSDLLGLYPNFRPKFANCYIPKVLKDFEFSLENRKWNGPSSLEKISLKEYGKDTRCDGMFYLAQLAIRKYIEDVKSKNFPSKDECYNINKEQLKDLRNCGPWKEENE